MISEAKKSKRIVIDMIINLAGTGVGLVVLQLIVYPIVARIIDSDAYGQMQSIMSVIYLVSGTLGTALSTTRLVREMDYKESGIKPDFSLFSLISGIIVVVTVPVCMFFYADGLKVIDYILVTIVAVLNFASNYYSVGLRLIINYKAIFVSKVLASGGYLIGFCVFYFTKKWEFIFIGSFLIETIYYYFKTKLFSEPILKSSLFKKTGHTFINLGTANLLSRALTYFDKLLLYPLLGGTAVSIYVTANVFGKLILMAIEPITNVILSYLSKQKGVSVKLWKKAIVISILGCSVMYVFCLVVSGPILRLFYPQWAEESLKLVPLTTFCLAISAFINIMYPFTLKAMASNKQIVVNCVGIIAYIVSVLILYKPLSITGCCIALIISYTLKLMAITVFVVAEKNGNRRINA